MHQQVIEEEGVAGLELGRRMPVTAGGLRRRQAVGRTSRTGTVGRSRAWSIRRGTMSSPGASRPQGESVIQMFTPRMPVTEEGAVLVPVGVGVDGHPPQRPLLDRQHRSLAEMRGDRLDEAGALEHLEQVRACPWRVDGPHALGLANEVSAEADRVAVLRFEGDEPRCGLVAWGSGLGGVERRVARSVSSTTPTTS